MRVRWFVLFACLGGFLAPVAAAARDAPSCEVARPVRMADLDWESNAFHVAVARFILEKGYGCAVETVPGSTLPLLQAMARGDVDVTLEIWADNMAEALEALRASGRIDLTGVNYADAEQGWYVPRYLVEGGSAPAPGLKAVTDLPRYKFLFRDREEPDKGRFYNGVTGWTSARINTAKLQAYGLSRDFTNVRAYTSDDLEAAVAAAYRQERPILYYGWSPSWISGTFDGVRLAEPAFDAAAWQRFLTSDPPERPTAYPATRVLTAVNADFARAAPRLRAFVAAYRTDAALVSHALTVMRKSSGAEAAARDFLRTRADVWRPWLPAEVAERVDAALR